MASEITLSFRLQVKNGQYQAKIEPATFTLDQSGMGAASGIQIIGTSAENLNKGDLSTLGYLFMQNLDSTNFVTWGLDNSGIQAVGKMEAGEIVWLRVKPGVDVKLLADTAACKVQYLWLEN